MNSDEITVSDYMDAMAGQAARDIVAERVRQITVYDFDADHDDIHDGRQIAEAAAAYGLAYAGHASWAVNVWPWDAAWWKPSGGRGRRRDLVKAGALILAEIERLDRLERKAMVNGNSRRIQ